MRKIPTLFIRDARFKVTEGPHPDCQWVLDGEGRATEKLDGTNLRLTVRAGQVVRVEKRRNPGKTQKAQGIFEPWYVDADPEAPADRYLFEAVQHTDVSAWPDGEHSAEALGPKIQGNPLALDQHRCVAFDLHAPVYAEVPRGYDGLREFLRECESLFQPGALAEGLVFHHRDGRRAKIKRKDFDW
ncbi:hypothetical protein [Acanthopleuribacter pedis]|uniref:RNA ligase domain-containing protein n=1 Tax=Acanthopleuribacter pedis TaxID=442870 RepID=A0A8J7Q877_9BACT|nr:hypothetical protein [Acanthopleuribacter pedis]MBO1322447.1 hypothetical protein [Acanthopleuribacter pedis]